MHSKSSNCLTSVSPILDQNKKCNSPKRGELAHFMRWTDGRSASGDASEGTRCRAGSARWRRWMRRGRWSDGCSTARSVLETLRVVRVLHCAHPSRSGRGSSFKSMYAQMQGQGVPRRTSGAARPPRPSTLTILRLCSYGRKKRSENIREERECIHRHDGRFLEVVHPLVSPAGPLYRKNVSLTGSCDILARFFNSRCEPNLPPPCLSMRINGGWGS